jgi:preprotein translocase subunit SecD
MQFYKPMFWLLLLLCGCAAPPVALRFHEQVSDTLPEAHMRTVDVPETQLRISIDPFPQLNEKDVAEAVLEATPGGPAIRLKFDAHGANKLNEMTTRMRGRYLVVLYEDKPVAAVLVDKRITNGEFLLETDLSDEEQKKLVENLNRLAGRSRDYGDTHYKP